MKGNVTKNVNSNSVLDAKIFQTILDAIPISIYWKHNDGSYGGCNQYMLDMAGLSSRLDIIGKKDSELKWADIAPQLTEIDKHVIDNKAAFQIEEYPLIATGEQKTFLTTKTPLLNDDNEVIGLAGISVDITAQKFAEAREREALAEAAEARALAQAEAELRQSVMVLAGSIAHDLRTPLLIVRALSEVMDLAVPKLTSGYELAQAADAKSVERISPLHWRKLPEIPKELGNVVTEMNDYINVSLKSLSQVLTKDIKWEDLEICDAESCVKNALGRYPFLDNDKALVHTDFSYTFNFKGNQVLVFRILSNLIKNALEQIKKNGYGEIFISMRKAEAMNQLIIKDTAGGASPEIVAHLFGGYKSTKDGGTGVGLAFCKLTMDTFQGTISAQSVEGKYIAFILGFPVM